MKKSTKIALGILGAAAVGVVIGSLFYTEKGKEIRSQVGDKASNAKDNLAKWYKKNKEKIAQATKKAGGVQEHAEDFAS